MADKDSISTGLKLVFSYQQRLGEYFVTYSWGISGERVHALAHDVSISPLRLDAHARQLDLEAGDVGAGW